MRRSRTTRPSPGRYKITDRDLELLFAVGRMGFATSHQLNRLFFGDQSTALRRLSKLVAMKLLNVAVVSQDQPNAYTLGSGAAAVLGTAGFPKTELHKTKVGKQIDSHLQAINDLRIEFVLATREPTMLEVQSFLSDLDLRRRTGSQTPVYLPDALITLRTSTSEVVLVVEVDLGTEGIAVFQSKVDTTVALWTAGHSCWGAPPGMWRPVVFVPSDTRARSIARGIVDAKGGDLWLVAELDVIRRCGALGKVFATASEVAGTPRTGPIQYQGSLAPSTPASKGKAS